MSGLPVSVIVGLWVLVIACETGLMLVLFWRKAWQTNAAFTAFIVFCVLRSCLLFCAGPVMQSSRGYFLIWWAAYVPQSVLLIALVLEVIQIVFRPYEALPRGTLGNFAMAVFALLLLTVSMTLRFPGIQATEWMTFLRAMDQGVSWALLGVFSLIAGFASLLGIPWNHRVYGVVAGFLFYLSVDVAVVTMTAHSEIALHHYIGPLDMLAFLFAASGWTYCFARAEVPRSVPKLEEVQKIAAVLSQYVFVIESLEVKKGSKATLREKPVLLRGEGQ